MELLIIDPQNDFCRSGGSLEVPGADADMDRLALLISRLDSSLSGVTVTLDSHHRVDISHPLWWRDPGGAAPTPFTVITPADVRGGDWNPARGDDGGRSLAYLTELAARGRHPHVIWPEHCLIGSAGHNVERRVNEAVREWEARHLVRTDFVRKGENPWTEHFSAICAEVPDPRDPYTQPNAALIARLEAADRVLIAGEALSHCVANTVRDLADGFSDPASVGKLVLLTDATSSVPGFEAAGEAFVAELTARGMRLSTCADARTR